MAKILLETNDVNHKKGKKMAQNSCENCMYYEYDYDLEDYYCSQSCLDEDDVARLSLDSHYTCPYYREGNEYTIVRKQI